MNPQKILATDFNKKPRWFTAINKSWQTSYYFGTRPRLEKDELIRKARKTTGLNELGKDFWDEPLERLLKSIKEEANLHPVGLFITQKRLENLIATRLRAEYWFRKFPEILEMELYPVILIAGLQRTGTTKLQRLLGADPDNRTLLSWEALNPAPYISPYNSIDPRIKFARMAEKSLKLMAPGFFAIHPVEHLAEEEDILLLDVSFMSTTPEATMHVPSYAAWLENTDQSYAYAYCVKLLKLLQWQRPGKRWVLKSPHHLEFFPLIDKYMGEVQYVWTHREITRCLPSFLSMTAHSRTIFSNEIALKKLTAHWLKKTAYMLDKAIDFRKSLDNNTKFTDIFYDDFIQNPIHTLEGIYKNYSPINTELRNIFEKANLINYRGKYGSHDYHLSDFSLSTEEINLKFAHYISFIRSLGMDLKERKNDSK